MATPETPESAITQLPFTPKSSASLSQIESHKKSFLGNKAIATYLPALFALTDIGCCAHCAFRFSNQRLLSLYQIKPDVLSDVIALIRQETSEAPPLPPNPPTGVGVCIACFDIIANSHRPEFTTPFIDQLSKTGYQFRHYSLTVSLPNSVLIRQYSIWYYLRQKFPNKDVVPTKSADEVVDVKEAMKWLLGPMIDYRLAFSFKNNAEFRVNLTFTHTETQDEAQFLTQVEDSPLRPRKNRKKEAWRTDAAVDSLNSVLKALRSVSETNFLKFGNCPPKPVKTRTNFELTYEHMAVFICGRYNKYVRDVCQSGQMWITADKPCETSVEKLIIPTIQEFYKADYARFSASGREDMDVRMLGDGRPFMIELINPHRCFFGYDDYREMERIVNSATTAVSISRLQHLDKHDMPKLKDAEDTKRKNYRCIVWMEKKIVPEELEFLKDIKDLELIQKTPIRVLHRRSLADRKKIIHGLSYEIVNDHILILNVYSSAGTYIKEFVHGDLGRTLPNFGTIMKCQTDILQLDVTQIEIEFPSVPVRKGAKNDTTTSTSSTTTTTAATTPATTATATTATATTNIATTPTTTEATATATTTATEDIKQ